MATTLYRRDDPVYKAVLDALIRTPFNAKPAPGGKVAIDPYAFVQAMLERNPGFAGLVRDGLREHSNDGQLPRLGHLEDHLRNRAGSSDMPMLTLDRVIAVLPLLLHPLTMSEIARQLGPEITKRMVDTYAAEIRGLIPLPGTHIELYRVALLRVAAGFDPCWCEQ